MLVVRMSFSISNDTLVYLYWGDITSVKVDAVVNVGNNTLSNKAGLNRAMLKSAGKPVVDEIKRKISSSSKPSLNFGETLVTSGGSLGAKNIIHTVSVVRKNSSGNNSSAIQEVMEACLMKAKEKKFKTLAFPALGTGLSRIAYGECINGYVRVLKSWKHNYPKEIHFVICKTKLLDEIRKAFSIQFTTSAQKSRNQKGSKISGQDKAGKTDEFQCDHSKLMAVKVNPGTAANSSDICPICLCDLVNEKILNKCGHSFCSACIDHSFSAVGPYCPICQTVYSKIIGLQPPGTMTVQENSFSLPGFPECTHYQVDYSIPNGIQEKNHPNPGKRFFGTRRTAYLPSNEKGKTVLKMLQRAFQQKLIFTVGVSRTTNMSDVVTWNDIHHKTSITGGSSRFGYPDSDYLKRVSLELEAKGITPKDVSNQKIQSYISN